MSACGQSTPESSDNSTDVYIPRDYLSEWAENEFEVRVTDVMYDTAVVGLPSEVHVSYPYGDERQAALEKEVRERYERRFNAYYGKSDVPDTIEIDVFGTTMTLEREKVFYGTCISEKKRDILYKTTGAGGRIQYTKDGSIAACENYSLWKSKPDENGQKAFNNFDEALECAKKFMSENVEIVDDFENYTFTRILAYDKNPTIYAFVFAKHVNNIKVSEVICYVNEYAGVCGFRTNNCDKDTRDFYLSCVKYATSPEALRAVTERLEKSAEENPEFVAIKDVELLNCGRDEEWYDEYRDAHYPAYKEYGRVSYYEYLDKTGVDIYCKYTAVMADGTEKSGINLVTVFIPIDWAEEFGEK